MCKFHFYSGFVEIQDWALPLIALQYHEVQLNFTFGRSVGVNADVNVECDHFYLDTGFVRLKILLKYPMNILLNRYKFKH